MTVNELIADLQERVRKDPLLGTCEAVIEYDGGCGGLIPHEAGDIREIWDRKQRLLVIGRT